MPKRIQKPKKIGVVKEKKHRKLGLKDIETVDIVQAKEEAEATAPLAAVSTDLDLTQLVKSKAQLSYVVADLAVRFRLLFTFVRANFNKRVVVFVSSPACVKYFGNIFKDLGIDCAEAHERQSTQARDAQLAKFAKGDKKVLVCSNSVADLVDFQGVSWSIHYDVPSDVQHLVKTWVRAKSEGGPQILLVLADFEVGFAKIFESKGVPVMEYNFPESKLAPIGEKLTKLVATNFNYAIESRDAYKAYVCFYYGHSFKEIFDGQKLDLKKVALSFGLTSQPRVAIQDLKTKQPNIWKKYHRKTMSEELKLLQAKGGELLETERD